MNGIAIIGCGEMGKKRIRLLKNRHVLACADTIYEKALHLAQQFPDCQATTDWRSILQRDDIDIVIVATLHAVLAEIALAAIQAGKHVLIEKPAAKSSASSFS